jgi:hypothetical protein
MAMTVIEINEKDYDNDTDIGLAGLIQEVGIDYEAQEKNCRVSINGSPFRRRDDPQLAKYQFVELKKQRGLCRLCTLLPNPTQK